MPPPEPVGDFAWWYGIALLLLLAAAGLGATRRAGDGRVPAGLVGAACLALVVAASGWGPGVVRLPLYLGAVAFDLRVDPLSRWFLGITGLVGVAIALFAPGYLAHQRGRVDAGFVWAGLAALLASITGVVLAANAIAFLVAWEAMALSSFLLVAADHRQRAVRRAALIYLGATRVGTAFLMAGFLWMHHLSGSWDFADWRAPAQPLLGPALLIFIGLATKAGCWPFHLWLPIAHPAAPAPVSALMSGVMIKTAIYAMARLMVLGGLGPAPLGLIVLALGAISALWGVLFALLQHDLKRLLAYHSVENIGIILMGLGLAMLGNQLRLPLLAQLGLAAALFHTLNHALFKALLFLSAGAVDARAHQRDIEHLGGLIHRMPWTGACFLAGSAAICALPPLNGFASEWLLYRALLGLAAGPSLGFRLAGLLLAGWLALVGVLALACFVKAAGVVFLGRPRSGGAARAEEATPAMVLAQVYLAVLCACFGLAAPAVLARLQLVVAPPGEVTSWIGQIWSLPLSLLALTGAATVMALTLWMGRLARTQPNRTYITWECGFGELGPRTQYTAASFAQPIVELFAGIYHYTVRIDVHGRDRRHFPDAVSARAAYEPYLETRVYTPLMLLVRRAARGLVMRLQAGSIHQYLVFIVLAQLLLLWWGFR